MAASVNLAIAHTKIQVDAIESAVLSIDEIRAAMTSPRSPAPQAAPAPPTPPPVSAPPADSVPPPSTPRPSIPQDGES
ncbi:hypothetical protein AKJ09_00918 [Labilithrix luteola]|uniref:Uncharacterized protein n=1 Tax=Labilithrix luteola TaxID=1391654 RepID=A0A0K1PMD7_9BACT|nr:hypothetical protein [Labilithrix luteola]AKU94254.1 hypothetical protein AKJ09_00918 [Labilithrix luteola]